MRSVKILLLTLCMSLGLSSCDDLTGSWVRAYINCGLYPEPTDYEGRFSTPYLRYYADTHILGGQGRPLKGQIQELDLILSSLEISTEDNLEYWIRNLTIVVGDRAADKYVVGDVLVKSGKITIYDDYSFDDFMRRFVYNLDYSGKADIAVTGWVYERYSGRKVQGATIDIVVKNDLNVRLRD